MKKSISKYLSVERYKICNICGTLTGAYQVIDNAPICNDHLPEIEIMKPHKIPNEKQMLTKILEKDKKLC